MGTLELPAQTRRLLPPLEVSAPPALKPGAQTVYIRQTQPGLRKGPSAGMGRGRWTPENDRTCLSKSWFSG